MQQKAQPNRIHSQHGKKALAVLSKASGLVFCSVSFCISERECCSLSAALVRTWAWLCGMDVRIGCAQFVRFGWLVASFSNWEIRNETVSMTITDSSTGVKLLICMYKCNINKYKLSTDYCWSNNMPVNCEGSSRKALVILWVCSPLPWLRPSMAMLPCRGQQEIVYPAQRIFIWCRVSSASVRSTGWISKIDSGLDLCSA